MNAVDTNILIYVQDPRDTAKQAKAAALVKAMPDAVLLWQVANEYIAASRKLEQFGYSRQQAFQDLSNWRRVWTTKLPTWGTIDRAAELDRRFSLSFWDAMIIAACLEGGVARLYSEDFDAYKRIDGLQLENPFAP
jgi:predicted nucleic acid-binding protein